MRFRTALLAVSLILGGCDPSTGDASGEQESERVEVVCAAQAGGHGGAAGQVWAQVTSSEDAAELAAVVVAAPGAAGKSGRAEHGPSVADGEDGAPPERDEGFTSVEDPAWMFDASGIDPDWRVVITEGASELALGVLTDPPLFEVTEFRIAAGQTFWLSCDTRIRAQTFIVEEGARLHLRSRNVPECVISSGSPDEDSADDTAATAGQRGVAALIEAGSIHIDGTIDLSGAAGDAGGEGGASGSLTLFTGDVEIGPNAEILVSGGAGGDGLDERPCGEMS